MGENNGDQIIPEKENGINKNTLLCGVIFAVYAILTFIGAVNHELWFDEAQAWVIVRDNDIKGIFHALGYEGHPPLWYLILYIPAHMGLPCTIMPFISWFVTAIAGAVVMFKAPFHVVTKSAILFSGGFLFVNSIMSRSYCLINLFIVLIALVYPKRKQFPILYGMLIGLLANTHICMSGFIGIIGIFMLIDLFKGFKTNGAKQNIKELTGLAVAGIGVLAMVIPLLSSASLNSETSKMTLSAFDVISAFPKSFMNISLSLFNYSFWGVIRIESLAAGLFSGFMAAVFAAMIIVMRHKTRPFLMLLFFWIFYVITTEIMWITIPSRALIFTAMFLIIAWIGEAEPQNNAVKIWSKIDLKTDTKMIRKIIEFIKSSDENFRRSYIVMITAILLISVPTGAYYLFSDYAKSFSLVEGALEYIQDSLPENSVIITRNDGLTEYSAYMPECKLYALEYARFYTYTSHEAVPEEISYSKIYDDLKEYDDLYFVYVYSDIDYPAIHRNVVYSERAGMPYATNARYIEILEFDLTEENVEKIIDPEFQNLRV